MILADKITEERKKNGWSQEELANQLGVSTEYTYFVYALFRICQNPFHRAK